MQPQYSLIHTCTIHTIHSYMHNTYNTYMHNIARSINSIHTLDPQAVDSMQLNPIDTIELQLGIYSYRCYFSMTYLKLYTHACNEINLYIPKVIHGSQLRIQLVVLYSMQLCEHNTEYVVQYIWQWFNLANHVNFANLNVCH